MMEEPARSRARFRKPRILVVDDDPAVLRGLQRILRAGQPFLEVHTASNGRAALDSVERLPFHIVMTDLNMPVMNGLELLDELAKYHPRTIRLIHSSHIDAQGKQFLVRRAHGVLIKPASVQEIVDLTAWALNESTWGDGQMGVG